MYNELTDVRSDLTQIKDSIKSSVILESISEIQNADIDVDENSEPYTYGQIKSVSGSVVSVYYIENNDSVNIKRYGTTSVLALVSNTLYSSSDVPVSNIDLIRYTDGNEYIYNNSSNHKYLYICSSRSSASSYHVSVSVYGYQNIEDLVDTVDELETTVNTMESSVSAMESSVDELDSMKNGLLFNPISEIANAGVDTPMSTYTYGQIKSVSGSTVSVYNIEGVNSIYIKRYGTTSVLALVSNTLYSSSDVPTSVNIPAVRYVDGNEYTYQNSNHYKYLYIVSSNNSAPNYSVYLSADGYPNIEKFIESTNTSIADINEDIADISEDVCAFENVYDSIAYEPIEILNDVDMNTPGGAIVGDLITLSGSVLYVYDIRSTPALVVKRPSLSSVIFLLSNILFDSSDIPQSGLSIFRYTQGNECVFDNPNGYRYLYITVKRSTDANYTATVGFNIPDKICELNQYVYEKYTDLPVDIVCTYKNMYVANHFGELRFSNDDCHTWTKTLDVSTYGTIKSYHLFDNGCIAFFTHQKAYYSEDWQTIHEATVYEKDGTTTYSPSTYDNFTTTKEAAYRKYIGTQDLYVFGNYGITDESNTRRNIYGTFDNGHSYRVLYEFNITGSETIRHIHTVIYNPNFDKFLCLTGDSTAESHVFEFTIVNNTSVITLTAIGNGPKYKWAGIEFYGKDVYYCLDQTPGVVLKSDYKYLSDLSKHEVVLDNLPNDAIGLFIGERGDMLVTISKYRSTGQSNSPFSIGVDCLNVYYSSDRKNFEMIHTANITNTSQQIYYGFFSPNSDGRILSGVWPSNVNLDAWDKLPSVDLAYIVKKAGYPKAFKPYNKTYEVVPVLSLECDDFSVEEDSEAIYTVKVFPFNATVKTWEIVEYNSDYLTVSGTTITGRSAGNTQIKIRSKSNYSVTKTVNVTVTPK